MESEMDEKIYKRMGRSGAWDITIGIILVVVGVAAGVLSIINGAKLLKDRTGIMF